MDIKVKNRYIKESSRKIRPILMNLRNKKAEAALISLAFTAKKGAKITHSLLKSAMAIAKENDLPLENMYIKSIYCNEGPRLKRRHIGSRGRSMPITKRMSHIELVISDELTQKEIKTEDKKEADDKVKNSKKQETITKQ